MVSGRRVAGAGEGPYHATVTQVLLVEDDERISQPLLHMLGREGWAPLHAADGAAALAALAGTTPSLVPRASPSRLPLSRSAWAYSKNSVMLTSSLL